MEFSYKTKGVCARSILIDVEDDTVKGVRFEGGCSGNTQGVATLVEGMKVDDVIKSFPRSNADLKIPRAPRSLPRR